MMLRQAFKFELYFLLNLFGKLIGYLAKFLLVLGDQRKYSEKSEICICLDPFILNRFLIFWPPFGLISVFL